jgi:hypothetical protein
MKCKPNRDLSHCFLWLKLSLVLRITYHARHLHP